MLIISATSSAQVGSLGETKAAAAQCATAVMRAMEGRVGQFSIKMTITALTETQAESPVSEPSTSPLAGTSQKERLAATLLDCLRQNGPMWKASLAASCGIPMSKTVTAALTLLRDEKKAARQIKQGLWIANDTPVPDRLPKRG